MRYVCDFCHREPRWWFPCETFAHPLDRDFEVTGDWAACDGCRDLVDAERFGELVDRALASPGNRAPGEHGPAFRAWLSALYAAFRRHRLPGPVAPIEAGPFIP